MAFNSANFSLIGSSSATCQKVYNYDAGSDNKGTVEAQDYFAGQGLAVHDLVLVKVSNPSPNTYLTLQVSSISPHVQINALNQFQ